MKTEIPFIDNKNLPLTITNNKTKKSITFTKVNVGIGPSSRNPKKVELSTSKNVLRKIVTTLKILNINWSDTTWSVPGCSKIDCFNSGDPMFGYLLLDDLNPSTLISDPRFKSLTINFTLSN